jgi:ADP-heptose:LPS heptosyltransferase
LANLGFCQLAQRNWKEGWINYRQCIGHDWRPRTQYADEPDWDGKKVDYLCLYAEQGLGDVISFSSMIPYAEKKAKKVVVEVDARLKGLIQRSFPNVKVYGTREQKKLAWAKEDHKPDASLPLGQLGEYCRLKDSDFPGTPYLKVDPDRAYMWKQLFKKKKKPVIGLAWRGGIPKTGARYRQWDLEQLLPILQSVDAHWVSLQYKSAAKEIEAFRRDHPEIDLVEYPHATLTNDYDDTAALVSALDQIVCMQTAVTHLAGGLGIKCWTHIPMNSQWRYGGDTEEYIWNKSVRLIRQKKRGEWEDVIKKTAGELSDLYNSRVPRSTGKATRNRGVRNNRPKVRKRSKSNHRHNGDRPSA